MQSSCDRLCHKHKLLSEATEEANKVSAQLAIASERVDNMKAEIKEENETNAKLVEKWHNRNKEHQETHDPVSFLPGIGVALPENATSHEAKELLANINIAVANLRQMVLNESKMEVDGNDVPKDNQQAAPAPPPATPKLARTRQDSLDSISEEPAPKRVASDADIIDITAASSSATQAPSCS